MPRGVRSIVGGYRSKEHPDYEVWCSMRKRCNYKNGKDFKYYGGRGITYQESWDKFENFISDMGERKNKLLTLDRIDVNKNYTKENCRWATRKEQVENRRLRYECVNGHKWTDETTIITHNGTDKSRRCKICYLNRMAKAKVKDEQCKGK